MFKQSAPTRIAITLGVVCLGTILAAQLLGLFPDTHKLRVKQRGNTCEVLAVNCSILAARKDSQGIEELLRAFASRNPEVLSVGLRRAGGDWLFQTGDHAQFSSEAPTDGHSTENYVLVPIFAGESTWGTVEVRFRALPGTGWWGSVDGTFLMFAAFVAAASCLQFSFYMRRILVHLDPSRAIPERVRHALNTLAEGVVVLDQGERIVLANQAFCQGVGSTSERLLGSRVSQLPWQSAEAGEPLPWAASQRELRNRLGAVLTLDQQTGERKFFKVNASPVLDEHGVARGTIATFDDITVLETKQAELLQMLEALRRSREEIGRQNEELQVLATRDSLTGCLNRRTFFEEFEKHWRVAARYQQPLCCVMVDVDHFKSINDNHGHAMGDEVLRKVAQALMQAARDTDVVCRYGGEEFCVLMPQVDLDQAEQGAERLRHVLIDLKFDKIKVTASLGVSSVSLGATSPQDLIDQADKCLYVAKRNGRNQVVRWDRVDPKTVVDEKKVSRTPEQAKQPETPAIPYPAVHALFSALSFRDAETAAHSKRVADLAVAVANRVMSVSQAYVVEIASLLHDIGKIGVPDTILLKPGPLTEEEWQVMRSHERIGVEIIAASFNSTELADIVRHYRCHYAGTPAQPQQPSKQDLPLGARILAIAEAYDAMVTERVYRKARTPAEACAELERCAGRQFDPELVRLFVDAVADVRRTQAAAPSAGKEFALQLGLQLEQLALAVDQQDFSSLAVLAKRLESTARKQQHEVVATQAARLSQLALKDPDYQVILESTRELLDLCCSSRAAPTPAEATVS